ncbi:hypothetical protein KUCAC02_013441 [Chaenocephalus aceratus]|nr:hypothetical protein KUCAC02_013441 [Chaenocephalus aceratus]
MSLGRIIDKRRLNETFTASEEQPSVYTFSPSRPCYPAAGASVGRVSQEEFLRGQEGDRPQTASRLFQKLFQRAYEAQITVHPATKANCATEDASPSRPPYFPPPTAAFPLSQLPQRRGSGRTFPRTPPCRQCGPLTPRRKLDEDFLKVYHKFVCQNKSGSLNGVSCRLCARSSQASISSALAALALSPPPPARCEETPRGVSMWTPSRNATGTSDARPLPGPYGHGCSPR